LFQLVVGIGPPGGQFPVDLGGLLDGGQRVLPRPRSARLADRLFSELARSGRIASGWVLVGRTPRSLMLFAVAAEFQQVPPGTMERSSVAADWELAIRLIG
jgi:hypothetical protein